MLRLMNSLGKLAVNTECLQNKPAIYQTVRWRKPRWVPQAKSKIFRVPPRRVPPEDERLELMRLHNNYRTKIKSLRRYLTEKHCVKFLAIEDTEEQNRIFEEDFKHSIAINDEWNLKRKVLREKCIAEELEADLAFARKRREMELIKQDKKSEIVEDLVRKQKEAAKSFILPQNIDEVIDHALENPVDYNFALTLKGEKIIGRENNVVLEEKKMEANQ